VTSGTSGNTHGGAAALQGTLSGRHAARGDVMVVVDGEQGPHQQARRERARDGAVGPQDAVLCQVSTRLLARTAVSGGVPVPGIA
jgi:hypothetical protein